MTVWYNEPDAFAAQWLRNLIAAGHIAPGIVDERPIQEIEAWELTGFTQCHFFAGIGVWSHALRRAGWADDRPIWTGSCPCQPFSNAGKKKGFSDERHLWPYWQNFIAERKPDVVIGEQVASALEWIDLVSIDLEKSGYAFGASDLCAAGFDGAHIRQRNYFVGIHDTAKSRCNGAFAITKENSRDETRLRSSDAGRAISGVENRELSPSTRQREYGGENLLDQDTNRLTGTGHASGMADVPRNGRREECADIGGQSRGDPAQGLAPGSGSSSSDQRPHAPMLGRHPADWLFCRDGKWRPVEPGTFPLVNETSARVGRLRAYGNALDAETATQFCYVVKEICDGV